MEPNLISYLKIMVSNNNMNVFLTENPTVIILLDTEGNLEKVSTNIHPSLVVGVVYRERHYRDHTSNLPFEVVNNVDNPVTGNNS